MSTQKILQINPELFKFSGGKKSLKSKKEKKTKPIQDKNQSIKSNKIKKELLKKVKDYQKNKETEKLKEDKKKEETNLENIPNTSNLFESSDFEDSNFEREFNKSLTFLHDLSKKNKEKKKKKTLKTSNLDVNIEIPTDSLIYNSTKQPNYGCLKNGLKPTFRELNKTQKNTNNTGKHLRISLENNTYYNHGDFHNKYNSIKDNLNEQQVMIKNPTQETTEVKNETNINENKLSDLNHSTEVQVSKIPKNNNDSTNIEKSNFIDIIDNKIETINNLETNNLETKNLETNNLETNNLETKNLETNNLYQIISNEQPDIPKLRRITRTYKYKLGKKKDKRHIGLLIKNRETQKRIKEEVSNLKQKDIQNIKNYLREKNLIKLGSQAPNDVLRKLYEDSILSGEVTNTNNNNLLYNYLHP